MSNRIVPATYRAIIDEVIKSVANDFEDAGVEESVLHELTNRWEMKVVASRVAQFDPLPPSPPPVMARLPSLAPPPPGYIKTEPTDGYGLYPPMMPPHQNGHHAGPSMMPARSVPGMQGAQYPGVTGVNAVASPAMTPAPSMNGRSVPPPPSSGRNESTVSERSSSESTESPSLHPTPQKPAAKPPKPPKARPEPNDDEIGSDLDDSDDEELGEEDGAGEDGGMDGILCTYDKVQRVKNKWKCVLKDGIMHVNGRDYLFSKCTGEFDW